MNTSEFAVKWRLVRGLWWLSHVSAGVKQLPTPVTKRHGNPNFVTVLISKSLFSAQGL